MIMFDSIFNTWIFSIDTNSDAFEAHDWERKVHTKCLLGVWVTMCLMVPILLTMYLRIYRIKRVFEVYHKYLGMLITREGSIYSHATTLAKIRQSQLRSSMDTS